jgi:hypothetical protein
MNIKIWTISLTNSQFNEQSVQTSKNNKTSSKTEKSNTHSEPPVATNRIKNANKGGKK